jgi:hypothetical protein
MAVCGACSLAPTLAFANDPDEAETADVVTRPRPDYDARGIHMGSFYLYPSWTAGAGYSDNVFNTNTGAVADTFFTSDEQMRLRSNWAQHALNVTAEAKTYWYDQQTTENRTDWNVSADGRLDIARGTDISAEVHYKDYHEERGTDLVGGLQVGDPAEPTSLSDLGASLAFNHTLNRLMLSVGGSVDDITYRDTPVVGGGAPIDNKDRDRTVAEVFAKATYEVTPDTGLFVRGAWNDRNFRTAVDDFGFNHDSTGWTVDSGVHFSMTHLLVGELFAGYQTQDYADAAFKSTNGFSFGADLKWFPTMLTTVSLDGARTIEDTSITGSSGYVSTRGQVSLDHELLRNIILSGKVAYETDDYQDIVRTDDIVSAQADGVYLINNNFHLDLGWRYVDRNSDVTPFAYTTNDFFLALTGKL